MTRLLLLTTLIGLLFISPDGLAKSSKPARTTIKYENGDKYVGEVIKRPSPAWKDKKLRHGKGILHYTDRSRFDGLWENNSPKLGTHTFANGDVFEGSIDAEQRIFEGKWTFAVGSSSQSWNYPAGSCFTGKLIGDTTYSGAFNTPLTNKIGDRFIGEFYNGQLSKGQIKYANGDTFEGSFSASTPLIGKYQYGSITTTKGWAIPAGCTFDGNIATFTGTVDMKIANAAGDKFVGKLKEGQPDEGTMIFVATGLTETGKWQNGLSPRAYEIQLRQKEERRLQEERRLDSIAKMQTIIRDRKDLEAFENYIAKNSGRASIYITSNDGNNLLPGAAIKLSQLFVGKSVVWNNKTYTCERIDFDRVKHRLVIICANKDGKKTLYSQEVCRTNDPNNLDATIKVNYPVELSSSFYYFNAYDASLYNEGLGTAFLDHLWLASDCTTAYNDAKNYYIRKYGNQYGMAVLNRKVELGMTVKMVQAINGEGDINQHVSNNQTITVLSYGGVRSNLIATVISPINTYTFVNNRLANYTTNEGQGTTIWN